jgi:hypothetical protein
VGKNQKLNPKPANPKSTDIRPEPAPLPSLNGVASLAGGEAHRQFSGNSGMGITNSSKEEIISRDL